MPESIGKTLKRIRESKELSLEEVAEKTRISKLVLSNIEEDNLAQISSSFYAKGFVKSYSLFLKAMEEDVVKGYLSSSDTKNKKQTSDIAIEKNKGASVPNFKILADGLKELSKYKAQAAMAAIGLFCLWVLFIGAVHVKKFVWNFIEKRPTKAVIELPVSNPVKTVSEPVQSPALSNSAAGIELEVTAIYNTWIQVTSDGKLLFRGILKKDDHDIWRAKKDINLEVGNAGGVKLKSNGEDVGVPGKKGEKKKIVVTKDGVSF